MTHLPKVEHCPVGYSAAVWYQVVLLVVSLKLAMDLFVSTSSTFSGVDGNVCPVLKCKSSADV